ncbi:MGC81798 protein-like protein [Coccomyxa subellipsoidea C-169]|uniref:protein-serine/threonine phosphatase n=1 Tax=Coccomyxa subellipsoidea (strain C-169) TaxID=574566 RepID=I0Z9N7_COCSC|nr:MGC81798 protein-like protein [Coccomyxa subellipsoidea C-169]EIE27356.1 MGC81798 protein-like protein [Coccomyxa subellipsoidea C-169]|eukprot:XP_005651900.1 MGC81798 protein-like protein [Coccomyxa subellipsoidea C-169]
MSGEVIIKWSSKEMMFKINDSETVGCLKRKIEEETRVQPKRQKLLGLKAKGGKLATDDMMLTDLALKPGQKIMLIGHVTNELDAQADVAPHVQDDFDLEEGVLQELDVKDNPDFQEKLHRRIANAPIKVLNPPRPGKKCLVLDIDYTIFDLNSTAERPEELARPHLHEFMTAVYEHYDLIIWSATGMKWIEVKMRELGVSTNPAYKLTAFMDHKSMVTIQTAKYGVFDCKPLPVLWAKMPEYTPENTIMFDDLRRNYAFNPQNGLVIRPYKRAHLNRSTDRELVYLKIYLLKIASLESLASLKHKKWERYIANELKSMD